MIKKNIKIFKKILLILFITIFIYLVLFLYKKNQSLHPNIKVIHSFQEALPFLKEATDKTLILFDLDDTLIRGYDIGLANGSDLPIYFIIRAALKHPSLIIKSNWEYYYSIMWKNAKRFVIEPSIIEIIDDLKSKGSIVLGLTLIETGSYGIIKDFTKFRYRMLKDFDIEMTQKFRNVYFTNLPAYRHNYPELYKGILFSNRLSKDKVLCAFLDYYKLKPDKIIFFDDKIYNLDSVGYECDKKNIPYLGFHYLAKKQFSENKFNIQRALLELDYLIKYKKWITNEEADAILKNKCFS